MTAPWSAAHARLVWARDRVRGNRSMAVVDALVRPGDVVVDAGANIGVYTARLAQLVGPEGAVHAFEPHPLALERLGIVAAAEPGVEIHPVALADRRGRATLSVPRGEDGSPLLALARLGPAEDAETVEVETTTLDAALGADAGRVAFVKCDVEGSELAVLRGALGVLREARPRVLVELERRHAGDELDETLALFAELGYRGEAIGPDGPFPLADFDLERDQAAHLDPDADDQSPAYVNDFLFSPAASAPSASSMRAADTARS